MEDFRKAPPSRGAAKRRAQQIEELAWQALELAESEVRRLGWDETLLAELRLARQARAHGARRRQTKHLAALLRREEEAAAALEQLLVARQGRRQAQVEDFHQLERLRDRLCAAETLDEALREALRLFPACDAEGLAALALNFQQSGDRRPYREIFRVLRAAAERARA